MRRRAMPEQLSFPFPPVRNICGTCGCFWRTTPSLGECLINIHGTAPIEWVTVRLYEEVYDCHTAGQPGRA